MIVYYLFENNPEPQKEETSLTFEEMAETMPDGCQGILDEYQMQQRYKVFKPGEEQGTGNWVYYWEVPGHNLNDVW